MKNRTLILFFFLIGASLAGTAQGSRSSIMFKHRYEVLNTPDLALNSVKFHPNMAQVGMAEMNVGGERSSRRYENALHKRNAGIGLTAAGGTCLIGGSALLAAGVIGVRNDNLYGGTYNGYTYSPLTHVVEIAFGAILAIAGTAMTIPGAILLARGQHDIKKYKDSQQVN
jgi:hypothetical protein